MQGTTVYLVYGSTGSVPEVKYEFAVPWETPITLNAMLLGKVIATDRTGDCIYFEHALDLPKGVIEAVERAMLKLERAPGRPKVRIGPSVAVGQ